MFCDRCGARLAGNEVFCASCGKQVNAAPRPTATPGVGRVEGHARTLGMLWLAYAGFRLLTGWMLASVFASWWGGWWAPHVPFFLNGLLRGLAGLAMAGAVLGIIAGWGLLERQSWARILALILGFLSLFHFPIGTVLGIYTLWVLLPAESAREYQRTARTV